MGSRHPENIHVGFVGTGESTEAAHAWILSCADGVEGDEQNYRFPGFRADRGFYCDLHFDGNHRETITTTELRDLSGKRKGKGAFEAAVDLLADKLRLLAQQDRPPDYVVLALPDELVKRSGKADYFDADAGAIHRDLRRALKARAMEQRLPTQILLSRTTTATPQSRTVDHKSKCAWNFFTGLYYKCGGIPWAPAGLAPGTCFVGVSFHRVPGSKMAGYFTGVAQAFDEYGNGLVLRGQDFAWDASRFGSSPHIAAPMANDLVSAVLRRYRDETKQIPKRVVIHKTSEFWPEERDGFQAALKGVDQHDLVAVRHTSDIRLLRDASYPVLRGTHVALDDLHLLYTTGYISSLGAFPHGHVPLPLKLTDHIGDSSTRTVLAEVMMLTKMNWNSANFAGAFPITLRFAELVGEIMKEIPSDIAPLPQFKYYM